MVLTVTDLDVVEFVCPEIWSVLPGHSTGCPDIWRIDLVSNPAHSKTTGGVPPQGGEVDIG